MRRSNRPALGLGGALLAILATPAPSSAFSDPLSFERPALAAGGGDRHFTGSPADGYSCNVCHQGGDDPSLRVTGLPLTGYDPGVRYEVVVTWDAKIDKLSTALEFTDEQGRAAGSLRLPPEAEIQAPEYCEPASDGVLAASLSELANGRQIIHVPDCGSTRLRFLWTAPSGPKRAVWFSGSAVWSDGEADADHDGVTDYGRVLAATETASTWNAAGCAASGTAARGTPPWLLLAALAAALVFRARARLH